MERMTAATRVEEATVVSEMAPVVVDHRYTPLDKFSSYSPAGDGSSGEYGSKDRGGGVEATKAAVAVG